MKKLLSLAIFGFLALCFISTAHAGTGCVSGGTCNTTTTVSVTVTWGNLCIGSSGTFNFGTYTVSSSSQTVTGAFTTGYFFVDDLKGANSGYYTTVQMSGNLVGTGWEVISGQNVYMQTASTGVTLLAWRANSRVYVHTGMLTYQALNVARQLIKRDTANNQGILGMYGTLPLMQLVIPAYQGVGTYVGTLVYTLIEN